jgi:molybdenum cofactor synthesis domain-containing protein
MRSSQALLPGTAFAADRLPGPLQAIAAFSAALSPTAPEVEAVSLDDAYDRILARDVVADGPYPADPRSTMDGFAVASAGGAQPRRIVGEVRMGHAPDRSIGPAETLRIPTGGVLPPGADAVIPFEDVEERDGTIVPHAAPAPGDSFTPAGADLQPGDAVLGQGRRLGGPELGVLATLGYATVPVFRRPRVAIVSTGDELVDPGATPARGQIRDSNRYAIAATLRALGAEPVHIARAADRIEDLVEKLRSACAQADAVILTGGSSVGERDLTPDAIERIGGTVVVHGLRVKPGKPTVLAIAGPVPVIGLPGNPTSALLILEAVVAPVITALAGAAPALPPARVYPAGAAFAGRPGWTWFVPAEVRAGAAYPLLLRSAHTSLPARAHGYVVLSEDGPRIAPGEDALVIRFRSGGRP